MADIDDNTLILADQAEKAIAQVRASVRELLSGKMSRRQGNELARASSPKGPGRTTTRSRSRLPGPSASR